MRARTRKRKGVTVSETAYTECPQCRGAGEFAYPGDGLRTTKCAKCQGKGFIPKK
jgi:DnaJ-class molecular chaperone